MSVVKLLIIHPRKARGKILDLASYLVVRWRSHCTSASNWELPLLCYPILQGTSSLIKTLTCMKIQTHIVFQKELKLKDGRIDYHTYNNWFRSMVALYRPGENPVESKNPENGRKGSPWGKTQNNREWVQNLITCHTHTHTHSMSRLTGESWCNTHTKGYTKSCDAWEVK